MSQPGRNDPCPCGSGKKYKKCCLLAAGVPGGAYTQAERRSAQVALGRFGWRQEFDGDRAAAEARFWGAALDLVPEDERPGVLEQGAAFFQDWFTTDFRLASGRTLVEQFLEREGRGLRSGELRYLERSRLTHLRPYEVVGVRREEGFDLLDLWAGKRIQVQERLATRQVVQWDVLAARVMLGPDGVPLLDGVPYLYPARAKDAIMKELRSLHRRFRRRVRGDDVDFFKRSGPVFFLWWLEYVVLASRLAFRTAEGDEMVFASAVFDIRDREALERALASHPDLDRHDDGSYAWHEPGGGEEFRRSLGWFILRDDRVVLETTSQQRAERGRALLEALCGEAVRHRATSLESVERALERRPAKPPREADRVPPEVEAEVLGAYYDKHYRDWVDTALPALGGQTPREAAGSKTSRPRVIALLKDMESLSARDRLEGRPAYDFGWMWAELGLDRPG
ncbi:MAG: SEC-C domain-containing protein [Candidatus Rokubacteria bacterium]|nr:SEC-C domain-containing protein [Candidatus Rokubacteria bacterium]